MMAEGHFFRQGLTACCKPFGSGLARNTMASERHLHVFNAFSLLEGCVEQENNAHKNKRANFCFFLCFFSPILFEFIKATLFRVRAQGFGLFRVEGRL